MENKLEQLLNMLIQRGRKPWGKEVVESPLRDQGYNDIVYKYEKISFYTGHKHITDDGEEKELKCYNEYELRELVAKESLLWQFVCENKMVRLDTDSGESDSYLCYYNIDGYPKDDRFEMERDDYRFRLIESALKDESELESFILNNIAIKDAI